MQNNWHQYSLTLVVHRNTLKGTWLATASENASVRLTLTSFFMLDISIFSMSVFRRKFSVCSSTTTAGIVNHKNDPMTSHSTSLQNNFPSFRHFKKTIKIGQFCSHDYWLYLYMIFAGTSFTLHIHRNACIRALCLHVYACHSFAAEGNKIFSYHQISNNHR